MLSLCLQEWPDMKQALYNDKNVFVKTVFKIKLVYRRLNTIPSALGAKLLLTI